MRMTALALTLLLTLGGCQQQVPAPANEAASAPDTRAPGPVTSAPAPMPPATPATMHTYAYQCGDLAVTGKFSPEQVELSYGGKTLVLPIAMSASGARYADDKGNEFWGKGLKDAMFTIAGEAQRSCTGSGQEIMPGS